MFPVYSAPSANSNAAPVQQAVPIGCPYPGQMDVGSSQEFFQPAGEFAMVPVGVSPSMYDWTQAAYWAPYFQQYGWPEVSAVPTIDCSIPQVTAATWRSENALEEAVEKPSSSVTYGSTSQATDTVAPATKKQSGGGSPPSWVGVKGLGEPKGIGDNKQKSDRLIANLEPSPDSARQERAAKVMAWLQVPWITQVLSFMKCGCRIVQKALDVGTTDQREQIAESLQNLTLDLLGDSHGNHVLAKLIEVMPPCRMTHVHESLQDRVLSVARSRFGCRILERLIEHCHEGQVGFLLQEVMPDLEALARHQYGNFVVQHLLEHGNESRKFHAVQALTPYVNEHAKHRTASHVVQRMLEHADVDSKNNLVQALLNGTEDASLEAIMLTRYGSFVVQQLVNMASKPETPVWAEEMLARVKANYPNVKTSTFAAKNLM